MMARSSTSENKLNYYAMLKYGSDKLFLIV